jgi:hypothetical protein
MEINNELDYIMDSPGLVLKEKAGDAVLSSVG